MKTLSNTPAGGNAGHKSKTIRDVKIPYTKPDFSNRDIVNAIKELLIAEYAIKQKPLFKKIRGVETMTFFLSSHLKCDLNDVGKSIADFYKSTDNPLHIQTKVEIENIINEIIEVTIYITTVGGTTIWSDRLSGKMLIFSKESPEVAYLENDVTSFEHTDIEWALRIMIEEMFSEHQQAKIKKYGQIDPGVLMDVDFSYMFYHSAICIKDEIELTSDVRIRLRIDYFREDWTHIRVSITPFDSEEDIRTFKTSGDIMIWDFGLPIYL